MIRPTLTVRAASVLIVAGIVLAAAPSPASGAPAVPTQLNAADMTLFNGVRQAGLWEIPAGQMAAERGSTAVVRKVGTMIAQQHVELDQLVVEAANKLGAALPSSPTAAQQGWVDEMQGANGTRFDEIFVARLRAAHGKIFPVIGAVRAGTRNPVVRKLADEANIFVMHHMQMLESTGLVRYTELAPAALPAAQDTSQLALAQANVGIRPLVDQRLLWAVLIVMTGVAAAAARSIYLRRVRR
ncbi:DUF4142 domain-containing protein [Actinoplanes sp. ATCC 53533]|uniref:DUF4142 domain-containing protein n=1 Tax=Actinoplanes sp. ATCC 53533 TaxID=1288362 RepID=UPI000F78CB90|nr:DUF4142 domain-containing protein [Actinoplanes sp. ATCC 53533]RSM64500.1 DUF4142 domain-containing protein [Actinoplanes sp. ATCC 53533]